VKRFSRTGSDEIIFFAEEAILAEPRRRPEINTCERAALIKQWSSIMWAIITLMYRSYCRARLLEMRKYHLANHA
jgi:hypothetical protein